MVPLFMASSKDPADLSRGTGRWKIGRHCRRPLRVLHIGNVANNAYKNAKLLNEAGLDCDVMCYDYYHIMGAPEWEDADIKGTIRDQYFPDWSSVNLHGFQRPKWFAQGPARLCIYYLLARRRRQLALARFWWLALRMAQWRVGNIHARRISRAMKPAAKLVLKLFKRGRHWLQVGMRLPAAFWRRGSAHSTADVPPETEFRSQVRRLVAEFQRLFPHRADRLTEGELQQFESAYPLWQQLFREYDIIQVYATDVCWPLLCNHHPYVGFEHGTLRDIPYAPTLEGRLTALGYAMADGVFITNGDCRAAIPRLRLTNVMPMIHPIDERVYLEGREARGEGRGEDHAQPLRQRLGCRYLLLCPLRHDWAVKGTDLYLRALPELARRLGKSFRLLLTRWGLQVEDSKALIAKLGVEDLVEWVEPLCRRALIRLMKQVDVLLDQTTLPHFGATAPEGIAAGVPVLMSYRPQSTTWIVAEPAPLLPVFTVTDVVNQTVTALDPQWRKAYQDTARRWIEDYHSSRRVVEEHFRMYEMCLARTAAEGKSSLQRLSA